MLYYSVVLTLLDEDSAPPRKKSLPNKNLSVNKNFDGELPSEEELLAQVANSEDPYHTFIKQATIRAESLLKDEPSAYTEIHHIIPRHSGGSDDPQNLTRLTYTDHTIAHSILWVVHKKQQDRIAYQLMTGTPLNVRRELGSMVQAQHKECGTGFFNSDGQSKRAKKSVIVNRAQGTGAFDPENIKKAQAGSIKARSENPEKFNVIQNANLSKAFVALDNLKTNDPEAYKIHHQKRNAKARETQKLKGTNLYDSNAQRRKSVTQHGILLNGVRYSCDNEQRTYICETTFEYSIQKAPLKNK